MKKFIFSAFVALIAAGASAQEYKVITTTSGVESDAGKSDGNGIFITRYIFKK
jgi:hypothetical protein